MKRIFLFLGVVSFTTASAQQKELFDINKHLKKKNAEKSIITPKTKSGFSRTAPFQLRPNKNSTNPYLALPNDDKVYSSPAFNMPIVVPDMRLFDKMPNAIAGTPAKTFFLATIPNAAPPFRIPQMFK